MTNTLFTGCSAIQAHPSDRPPKRFTAGRVGGLRTAAGIMLVFVLPFAQYSIAGLYPQPGQNAALTGILRKMEEVGKGFRSFYARFTQKHYTAVLKEFDTPQTGELYYERAKDGSALIREEIQSPGKVILTINGGTLINYQPVLKQATIANLGKNKDKTEYLVLGIGQAPARLEQTYNITYQGAEAVSGSQCAILLLKPKNPAVAAYFSEITLWVDRATGLPVQQKLQEPAGDYLLVTFSDEKINIPIPLSKFQQKLPAGVEILRVQ